MAHKALMGGTVYEKYGGADLVGGTVYKKDHGKTVVGGTVYEVGFDDGMRTITLDFNNVQNLGSDVVIVNVNGTSYKSRGGSTEIVVAIGTPIKIDVNGVQTNLYGKEWSLLNNSAKVFLNGAEVASAELLTENSGVRAASVSYDYTVESNVTIKATGGSYNYYSTFYYGTAYITEE